MAILIKTLTIERAWRALVNRIMNGGSIIEDERGSKIKELLNTVVVIKDPLNETMPKGFFWQGEKLEIYKEQFLSPNRQGFVYTYGNRLREHFEENKIVFGDKKRIKQTPVDQVEKVIQRLKNNKETRRATMTTFDPSIDHNNDEIPCMILIDFKIRGGKLHTTGLWRSHDAYNAWGANAFGLTHLAKYVAKEVKVEVGELTIHSISAHVYEPFFEEAEKLWQK